MHKLLLPLTLSLAVTLVQAKPAQECLGRLTFTIPNSNNFEWALADGDTPPMANSAGFGGDMRMLYDQWDYSTNLSIMSTRPSDGVAFQRQWRSYMPGNIELMEQRKKASAWKEIAEELKEKQKEQQAKLARGEEVSKYKIVTNEGIEDAIKTRDEAQAKLNEMENRQIPVVKLDNIADEAYTVNYPQQRAFVRKNGRDYMFYMSNLGKAKWGLPETDVTVEQIHDVLKRFQARQLGEVPKTIGYCFPYGFINDNGNEDYAIKNSFRFKDQPNIAYVIYTGNNTRLSKGKIATHGVMHTRIPPIPKGYKGTPVNQTITLKNGYTLELKGWQITEEKPQDPKQPEHHYWVYGELKGEATAQNNPFVAIQIDAFIKNPEQGRPNNAPLLEQAIKRLIPVLETIKINAL